MSAASALNLDTLGARIERKHFADPERIRQRFLRYVEALPSGCWRWTGTMTRRGRAQFAVGYIKHEAARVAWVLLKGPLPAAARLKRRCASDPRCVSPHHHQVEQRKERVRGQQRRLTGEEVRALLRGYEGKVPLAELARMFGIHPTTVWYVVTGRRTYARCADLALPPPRSPRRTSSCEPGRTT
jgi:hypothetical protein